VPAFSRAVERQHQYPDLKLRLFYKDLSSSTALQSIKAELDQLNYVEAVPQARNYHLLLRQAGNAIATEGADTTEVSPRVPVSDANAVGRVVDQVKHWAKWFNVLSLKNPASTSNVSLAIKAIRSGETRDPFAAINQPEAVLQMGEEFECAVTNKSNRDFYVSILDLSTDGSVSVIYPYPEGAGELLKPGATVTKRFETFVPEGRPSVIDVIKVFATSTAVDFHILNLPSVRDVRELPGDPLGKLLAQATLGVARGSRPSSVELGNWTTAERSFKVKR
jgi:hypothetical protein